MQASCFGFVIHDRDGDDAYRWFPALRYHPHHLQERFRWWVGLFRVTRITTSFITPSGQTFGRAVYTSDLIALLDGVASVSHVPLQQPAANLLLTPAELATLGAMALTLEGVLTPRHSRWQVVTYRVDDVTQR